MRFPACSTRFVLIGVFLAVSTGVLEGSPTLRDGMPAALRTGLLHNMPAGCDGDICRYMPPEYPSQLIDDLINKTYHLTLAIPNEPPADRCGDDGTYKSGCDSTQSTGPVYYIRDTDYMVRVVVQHKIFKQHYRSVNCVKSGRLLRYDPDLLYAADIDYHNFTCNEVIQNYGFLVLTPDGNGVEFVKSKHGVPVACDCRLNLQ